MADGKSIMKFMINSVCKITSDEQTLNIAKSVTMNPNGRAAKHLEHYLTGAGAEMKVDLTALYNEDEKFRVKLTDTKKKAIQWGEKSGVVNRSLILTGILLSLIIILFS